MFFWGGKGSPPKKSALADFQPIRSLYSPGTGIGSGKPRDWSKTNGRPCGICCASEKAKFLQRHREVGTNVGHAQAGGRKREWYPKPVMPVAWASPPPSLIIGGGFSGLHKSASHCFRLQDLWSLTIPAIKTGRPALKEPTCIVCAQCIAGGLFNLSPPLPRPGLCREGPVVNS